ncbi:MAG: hypothetical protein KDI60_13590 [Xanthomonadales bacterium]|nr:hypothetical protein [Xanthomonadales bacterium]
MRARFAFTLLLSMLWAPLTAATLPENLRSYVSARVKVDREGRVQELGPISPALDPALEAVLRERMLSTAFEPARVNGQTAAVEAQMRMALTLRATEDGLKLAVAEIATGPKFSKIRKPQIPRSLLARGQNVRIVTRVEYDASGKVVDVLVERATVPLARIESMAKKVAMAWEFEPERVDGQPVPGWAIVPISLLMQGSFPEYTVKFTGGGSLKFQPEQQPDEREGYATALQAIIEPDNLDLALPSATIES